MIYPRVTNVVNGVYEKSATLSCPEMARLALLKSNVMEFDEFEKSIDIKHNVVTKIDTNNIKYANNAKRYFWELRIFSISLIQNREYLIADRLIILGIFLKRFKNILMARKSKLYQLLLKSIVIFLKMEI